MILTVGNQNKHVVKSLKAKTWMIMKLTIALLLFFTFQVSAKTDAQKITIVKNNIHLSEVFRDIEKQTGYLFFYDRVVIKNTDPIDVSIKDATLSQALSQCLKGQQLTYTIVRNTIVIQPLKVEAQQIQSSLLAPEPPPVELHGRVVNKNGEPLQNASVVISGTKTGTTTGKDGRFTLTAPNNKNIELEISSVGYQAKKVKVEGQNEINVILELEITGMSDVVVIGYGTQKKKDLTGSVSTISEKDIQSRPVPSFAGALQGRASGVQVAQTGGDLDGRFSIKIRGAGSVTSSVQPLIVVDGVPLSSAEFSTINPQDIASMSILKDASATAIYGARASNGVVIITTRRGKAGETRITLNANTGVEKIAKMYKVLTSEQQRKLFVSAFQNTARDPSAYQNPDDSVWKINTDWQKLATRAAWRQNYDISVSGGKPNNQFAVSGGYLKRQGVLKNTDITNYYFRANNDLAVGQKLKITSSFSGSYQTQDVNGSNDAFNTGGSGSYESLIDTHTYIPAYDSKGSLFNVNTSADPYFGQNTNPLINLLMPTRTQSDIRLLGSVKADYEIINGLTLSGEFGGDILTESNYSYFPEYKIGLSKRDQGSTTNASNQGINWVANATLTYKKNFGLHAITALLGYSAQQFRNINNSTTGTGTINNSLNQLSNQTTFNASGSDVSAGLLSSFVRLNYGYNEKYLVTATVRRDGSSKFGPSKQYGIFPSGSLAWNISKENFFKPAWVDNLKLRVSYGLTGNQNIPDFAFITKAGASQYAFGNTIVVGNSVLNVGVPDLQWESAKQIDAGFDIIILNGRVTSTIDYYDKKSSKLLVQVPLPLTAGVSQNPTVNLGSVENKGFEFFASSMNLVGKFKWSTDFNISTNKNRVLSIGTNSVGAPLQVPGTTLALPQDFANLTVAGQPVGAFYMYKFNGIWQTKDASEAAKYRAVPGDARYADLNNNGQLDAGDKMFAGSPQPTYYGGLNNTFSYSNFSLSVFMSYSGGNKIYNGIRNLDARSVPFNQQLAEVADFWTPDNPSNYVPRASQGGNSTALATRVSTKYLENGSYLKMSNISLSYNIPPAQLKKLKVDNARITLAGNNIFTVTKYKGLDPASASQGDLTSGGLDFTPYPPTRYYYVSLSLTF